MTIGAKRDRVQFLRKSRVKRDDGGYDVTTAAYATVWAQVSALAGDTEAVESGRLRNATLYNVSVDARAVSPLADDILVWVTQNNMQMNIREVRLSSRRQTDLDIVAEYGATESGV
jgi:hypothetical protein